MDKSQVLKYLDDHNILQVKFAFADIDGILRGKIIHRDKFLQGLEHGMGFCDVVFGWDSADVLYPGVNVTGWQSGFPDKTCNIDLATFRKIPWQDNMPFFLADFSTEGGGLNVCPRTLLKKINAQCQQMGFSAEFAQEFEWFNFKETPQTLADKNFSNIQPLTPGMFGYSLLRPSLYQDYNRELFTMLNQFNVPVEALHTETGPGVYEASIIHTNAVEAADMAVLLKTSVKEIAYRHQIAASFMAKWNENLPGCSGHIHQSLWDAEKSKNLFFDAADRNNMSLLMQQYIAGQLYCLPHILPMYAPTINSYKRLVDGAWAPTTLTWGVENRTTALRIINSAEKYTRIETRVPGSDTNPYLAIAAALASGLYGIKHQLSLSQPQTAGSAYADAENKRLPSNLYDAALAMQGSDISKELFGDDFVDHFSKTRLWECEQYAKQVNSWELKRYFEII